MLVAAVHHAPHAHNPSFLPKHLAETRPNAGYTRLHMSAWEVRGNPQLLGRTKKYHHLFHAHLMRAPHPTPTTGSKRPPLYALLAADPAPCTSRALHMPLISPETVTIQHPPSHASAVAAGVVGACGIPDLSGADVTAAVLLGV